MAERRHNTMKGTPMSGPTEMPDFGWIMGQQNWRDKAACLGTDPAMWFREHGVVFGKRLKGICAKCPVRQDCEDWVLDLKKNEDPGGFCAGMSPRQRNLERRKRAA